MRSCLLSPERACTRDHINRRGVVEPKLWSYNQGSMIGAGTLLYQATGNGAYLYQARQTAAAALAYFTPQRLGEEIPFFASVYFRNLLYLDSVTHDPPGPEDRPGLRQLRLGPPAPEERPVRGRLPGRAPSCSCRRDRADLRAAVVPRRAPISEPRCSPAVGCTSVK